MHKWLGMMLMVVDVWSDVYIIFVFKMPLATKSVKLSCELRHIVQLTIYDDISLTLL